jgi:hypothetical protein
MAHGSEKSRLRQIAGQFDQHGLLGVIAGFLAVTAAARAAPIRTNNEPAQLDVRPAGEGSIRITLKPITFRERFAFNPALDERQYAAPAISIREIVQPVTAKG